MNDDSRNMPALVAVVFQSILTADYNLIVVLRFLESQ